MSYVNLHNAARILRLQSWVPLGLLARVGLMPRPVARDPDGNLLYPLDEVEKAIGDKSSEGQQP
jgi:hypothetical protein